MIHEGRLLDVISHTDLKTKLYQQGMSTSVGHPLLFVSGKNRYVTTRRTFRIKMTASHFPRNLFLFSAFYPNRNQIPILAQQPRKKRPTNSPPLRHSPHTVLCDHHDNSTKQGSNLKSKLFIITIFSILRYWLNFILLKVDVTIRLVTCLFWAQCLYELNSSLTFSNM